MDIISIDSICLSFGEQLQIISTINRVHYFIILKLEIILLNYLFICKSHGVKAREIKPAEIPVAIMCPYNL